MDWAARQPPPNLHVSVITEAELRYGAEVLSQGRRRDVLRDEIEEMFREDFDGRVIPFDSFAAKAYATIAAAPPAVLSALRIARSRRQLVHSGQLSQLEM